VLQALSSGACTMDQFLPIIKAELEKFSINYAFNLTEEIVIEMNTQYKTRLEQWKSLNESEVLELNFCIN
jgi:hypothetical protein